MAKRKPPFSFNLVGEPNDLSSYIDPQEERLRNALKNQSGELVGTPYTPKSKFDQLLERLEPGMKMSSETPDISSKLQALENANTGFQLGEAKNLSTKIDPAAERLKNALKNQSGELVGTPYTPKSKFDQLIERLEPGMKMSSETPDISSKLKNLESSVLSDRAKQFSSNAGMAEDIDAAIEAEALKGNVNVGKPPAQPVGRLKGLLNKIASSKLVNTGLPAIGAATEAYNTASALEEGRYADAASHGLLTGSGLSSIPRIGALAGGTVGAAAPILGGAGLSLAGYNYLKENSNLPQVAKELQARGTSPFQLAKGGDEFTPTKEQTEATRQNEEFNRRANSATPISKKELEALQAPNSSSVPPKDDLNNILASIPKKEESTSEESQNTPEEAPNDSEANKAFQDVLNIDSDRAQGIVEQLKRAQEQAKQDKAQSRLMMAANQILGGALGLSYKVKMPETSEEFWKDRMKDADQGIKDVATLHEAEKEDPDSPISKRMREIMEPVFQRLNMKAPEKMSYSMIKENFPQFVRMYDSQIDTEKSKSENALTVGQKEMDKEFAKQYNQWQTGGNAEFNKNMQRLEEAKKTLKGSTLVSGRFSGAMPDMLRTEASKVAQQDVQAAAQASLKAILGPQFTEKEGERIMKVAYDPTLSEEENIKKIDLAIQELIERAESVKQRGGYFDQYGTLRGYGSEMSAKDQQAIEWAKKNPNDERAKKILKLHGI